MDENRRRILIYIINHLVRSNFRKRRFFSLIQLLLGRSRRRMEEHRKFLTRTSITMQTNLAMVFSYLSNREPAERRFWVMPRPQYWFEMLLQRRDLDSEWPKHFRVSRATFMKIVEIVRPFMTTQNNNRVYRFFCRPWKTENCSNHHPIWFITTRDAGTRCKQTWLIHFYSSPNDRTKIRSCVLCSHDEASQRTRKYSIIHNPWQKPFENTWMKSKKPELYRCYRRVICCSSATYKVSDNAADVYCFDEG